MITVRKIIQRVKGDPDYLIYRHDWYHRSPANVDWEMWVYPFGIRSRERIGEGKIERNLDVPLEPSLDKEKDDLYHILSSQGSASIALLYHLDYHHWYMGDNPGSSLYFSQFSVPKKIGYFVHWIIYEPDRMRWETGPAKSQLTKFYKNNFSEKSIYKM